MKKNNLDLDVLAGVVERGKGDPAVFKMHKRVEGTWSFAQGSPAYTASMTHGDRSTVLSVDVAPGLGGSGLAPDPLQYMLTGLAACYAATVVTVASMEGVALTDLTVVAEQDVDVARVYDMGDGPLMEQITVTVKSRPTSTTAPWPVGSRPPATSAPSRSRSSTTYRCTPSSSASRTPRRFTP